MGPAGATELEVTLTRSAGDREAAAGAGRAAERSALEPGGRSASGKRGCSRGCCWQAADRGRQTEPRCQQHPHWVPRPKAALAAGTEAAGGARGGTGRGGGARSPGTGSAAPQKRGERWGAAGRGLRRFPGGGIAPRLSAPELPSGEGRLVTQSATRVVPSGGPRGCRRRTVHPRQGRGTGVCVWGARQAPPTSAQRHRDVGRLSRSLLAAGPGRASRSSRRSPAGRATAFLNDGLPFGSFPRRV